MKFIGRKNDKYEDKCFEEMDLWRAQRLKKLFFNIRKEEVQTRNKINRWEEYCDKFYQVGLKRRAIKFLRLEADIAGNKHYKKKLEKKNEEEVNAMVIEKQL